MLISLNFLIIHKIIKMTSLEIDKGSSTDSRNYFMPQSIFYSRITNSLSPFIFILFPLLYIITSSDCIFKFFLSDRNIAFKRQSLFIIICRFKKLKNLKYILRNYFLSVIFPVCYTFDV